MKTSETTKGIFAALAQAQAVISDPVKNKKNPHFKSSYADLGGALPVIRGAFEASGLAFLQGTTITDGRALLVTRLTHASGEWVESSYPLSTDTNPQKQASAYTYARRNALFGMVGIAPSDDDGNAAAAKFTPGVRTAPARPAKPAPPAIPKKWTDKERIRFCADLTRLGWKYEDVAGFCASVDKPRPSGMSAKQRGDLYEWLKNGPEAMLNFIEAKGSK